MTDVCFAKMYCGLKEFKTEKLTSREEQTEMVIFLHGLKFHQWTDRIRCRQFFLKILK